MSNKEEANDPITNIFGIAGFLLGLGLGWQFSGSFLGAFIAAFILAVIGAAIGNIIFKILIFGVCLLAFFIRRAVTREVYKAVTNTETHFSPPPSPSPSPLPPNYSTTPLPNSSTPGSPLSHSFYLKNECSKTIRLALCYRTANNNWKTDGWWTWEGNKSQFLYSNNEKIQLTSPEVYVYAYIKGSKVSWSGSYEQEFDGSDLHMEKFLLQADLAGDYVLSLNCGNLDSILRNEKDQTLSRRANGSYQLGISGTDLHPCLEDGVSTNGILVNSVFNNSPAAKAGIQYGDIICRVDKRGIGTVTGLWTYLNDKDNPEDDVDIYYLRNGELNVATVTPLFYE